MEEELRPVPWHAADLIAFAAFFALVVVFLPFGVFLVARLLRPGFEVTDASGFELILIQMLIDAAVVGFAFFIIRLHGQTIRSTLHWVRAEGYPVGWLISAGAFLGVTALIVSAFLPDTPDSALEKLLKTPQAAIAFAVFGITLGPLFEEIIFRGFLYTLLADLSSVKVAVPVTSFAFAGLHFIQLWPNWPAVLVILGVGYFFTVIRQRSNSLIPSVIMHITYNSMIFAVSALSALFHH